jgi:type VI secretion system protein ImpE
MPTSDPSAQTCEAVARRFKDGALDDCIRLAKEGIRTNPAHCGLRVLLAEMHCFEGHFEKSDQQLDIAGQLDPGAVLAISQLRQIVRGAAARGDFYTAGRLPAFLSDPTEETKNRLRASIAIRNRQPAEANEFLGLAEQSRPRVSGACDDRDFAEFRDLDDLLSGVLELITADGRYFWVLFDQVRDLTFQAPKRAFDLLFRPVRTVFRNGVAGTAFAPTTYHGSCSAADPKLRLARATDWVQEADGPVRGLGQRIWLADDAEAPILDVRRLSFQE